VIYSAINNLLDQLFEQSRQKGNIQYLFTLLRVEGINYHLKDQLIELNETLKTLDINSTNRSKNYFKLISYTEPLRLIFNLIRCSISKPFDATPFISETEGIIGKKLTLLESAKLTIKAAFESELKELKLLLEELYPGEICIACEKNQEINEFINAQLLKKLHSFLTILLKKHSKKLMRFRNESRYIKLPYFEVMELLINDNIGLYGFKVHFANGTNAIFERHPDRVEHVNLILHPQVHFFVGNLDEMRHEWIVGNKRLYEIGLKGRYNRLGEWKPIIFPGKVDKIQEEIKHISDDSEIQGVLFYIICTGHKVIEFVMKSPLNLPIEKILCYDNLLFIYKCEQLHDLQEDFVYDCWFKVNDVDVKEVEKDINSIKMAINRLGISFGAPIQWRFKYTMKANKTSHVDPTMEDMNYFGKVLSASLKPEDTVLIEAEDWYNQGKNSSTPFISYLCFYNSIENLAINIAQGNTSISKPMVKNKKEDKRKCIEKLFEELYKGNPIQFVNDAYEKCLMESTRKKVEYAVEKIFGKNNPLTRNLYHKVNGNSLYDIRNKIAHGVFSLYDKENVHLVSSRMGEIETLSKEFILRILLTLRPEQTIPEWSRLHSIDFKPADPRDTLYVSYEPILGNNDWRIRPEWCS